MSKYPLPRYFEIYTNVLKFMYYSIYMINPGIFQDLPHDLKTW